MVSAPREFAPLEPDADEAADSAAGLRARKGFGTRGGGGAGFLRGGAAAGVADGSADGTGSGSGVGVGMGSGSGAGVGTGSGTGAAAGSGGVSTVGGGGAASTRLTSTGAKSSRIGSGFAGLPMWKPNSRVPCRTAAAAKLAMISIFNSVAAGFRWRPW